MQEGDRMGIGKNMTRVDAKDKVTGEARYTADLEPKGLLTAKVVRSTIANGVVKSFDLSEALAVPGVVKIVTCFDVPDIQFPTPGHPWSVETAHQDIADRKLLNTRVRVYGDDIAAVIAEDELAAARAARLVKVEYEEYEPLLTVEAAMAEGATRLHEEKPGNVIAHSSFTVGEGTFEEAVKEEGLVVIDRDYRTQSVRHRYPLPIWKRTASLSPHPPRFPILCVASSARPWGCPWAGSVLSSRISEAALATSRMCSMNR